MPHVGNLYMAPREVFRQDENKNKFRRLYRLQVEHSEIKPTMNAARGARKKEKQQQTASQEKETEQNAAAADKQPINKTRPEKSSQRRSEEHTSELQSLTN